MEIKKGEDENEKLNFLRNFPSAMGPEGGVIITQENFETLKSWMEKKKVQTFEELVKKTQPELPKFDPWVMFLH